MQNLCDVIAFYDIGRRRKIMHLHPIQTNAPKKKSGNKRLRRMSGLLLLMAVSASAQMVGVPASATSIVRGGLDPNLHTGGGPGLIVSGEAQGPMKLGVSLAQRLSIRRMDEGPPSQPSFDGY